MSKRKNSMILRRLILIILIFVIGVTYFNMEITSIDKSSNKKIVVSIPKGVGLFNIATVLKDNNLIKNRITFVILAKISHKDKDIKAGVYNIPIAYSNDKILTMMTRGQIYSNIVRVTIPEGYESYKIADKLASEGLVNKESFLELVNDPSQFSQKFKFLQEPDIISLEGYLFPDTYLIDRKFSEKYIIELMLKRFEDMYNGQFKEKQKSMKLSLNQFITIASIVEREAKIEKERPMIAKVFYNRLSINMPLQSCATVQYILKERKKVLSIEDTKINSPYNTYKNKGLPPGPIASPGKKSMFAALNPDNNNFLYFVAKKDGGHSFSTNYNDHLKRKAENEK